jgi:hypothetical protein
MIPHRILSNEISGSGLRDRVTACRKRLRLSRVTHRAIALDHADELFPETARSVSEFHSYATEYAATPASTVRINYSAGYEDSEDGDTLLLIKEQEVGIT